MSDRYFNCGGIKGKLSVKFFVYYIVLLRIRVSLLKCLECSLLVV